MTRRALSGSLWGGVLLLIMAPALGQNGSDTSESIEKRNATLSSFADARDHRAKLLLEIPNLNDAIDGLRRQKIAADQLQREKRAAEAKINISKQQLSELEKVFAATQSGPQKRILQIQIRTVQIYVSNETDNLAYIDRAILDLGVDSKKVDEELSRREKELSKYQTDLVATENSINEYLNVE